jgi:RimJ/RimL family protein N-acetyltransferase
MKVQIDAPGAGDWIMEHAGGCFNPACDHAFSSHRDDGTILGGIVLADYMGNSWSAHMGAEDSRWFSRELAWLVFDYAFNQCGCHKLVGPVRSDNHLALATDLRGGWHLEAVIRDLVAPGVHLMVLTMTRDQCPWLNYQPKTWRSNKTRNTIGPIEAGKVA